MFEEMLYENGSSAEALREPLHSAVPSQAEPISGTQAWQELLEGRWCLVDHFDHEGRRFWIARLNPPAAVPQRQLAGVERQVVNKLITGASQKQIAYELGLTQSTVSKHAAMARKKLGLATRAELIELYGTLCSEGLSSDVS